MKSIIRNLIIFKKSRKITNDFFNYYIFAHTFQWTSSKCNDGKNCYGYIYTLWKWLTKCDIRSFSSIWKYKYYLHVFVLIPISKAETWKSKKFYKNAIILRCQTQNNSATLLIMLQLLSFKSFWRPYIY